MPKTRIAIIGGGCAGLSAAIALAKQGWSVSLYEAGSELGGRARSIALTNASGSTYLDNGQHILIGASQTRGHFAHSYSTRMSLFKIRCAGANELEGGCAWTSRTL